VRILYFTRDYTPHDFRFLTALSKTEHEVFLLRLERANLQREDRPLPAGITLIPWRGGQRPASLKDGPALLGSLKRVLKAIQPDLVHAGPIQTPAFLTALAGFHPLVSMSWGSDLLKDADRNGRWRWATRFTLQHTDVLIGDCLAVQNKAAEFGFKPERVKLFPWGIDLVQFSPDEAPGFRERLGWQDKFVVLTLRSWEPIYGVDGFVQAFARAAQQAPDMRLLLLGNGSQAAAIHQIVQQNNLLDRVHFGGQVSNSHLPEYYHASDLYVSASHSDGSSVSLMEALGCGLPVLVSDIPGNKEWITSGQEGWLFADGNIEQMSQGLLQAYDRRNEIKQMGIASRLLAEKRADWSKNFLSLLEAYQMAVDKKK
jgi:glycosyltransferase involved in cell wall biosynthesis